MILSLVKKYSKLFPVKTPLYKTRQILNTSLDLYGLYNKEINSIIKDITKSNKVLEALDSADLSVFEVQLIYVKLTKHLSFEKFCYYLSRLTGHIDSWAITDAVEFHNWKNELSNLDLLIRKTTKK